jgi:curved DNA-binding protein CbpA
MRRINEAWRILSDPARRARYDAERTAAAAPGHASGTRTGAAPWRADGYGPRTTVTWAAWPESSRASGLRTEPTRRPDPVESAVGDRPAVAIALSVGLALMFFVGTWLGSVAR